MFLNARYGLAEILEDGLDVHVEPVGNVLQLEVLLEAQAEDAEVRLGEMSLCVVADGIERLHPLLVELPVVTKLDGIELAELVDERHLPDAVDAFVAYCREQVGSHLVLGRQDVALPEPQEHVLHCVLGFHVVVQECSGQM